MSSRNGVVGRSALLLGVVCAVFIVRGHWLVKQLFSLPHALVGVDPHVQANANQEDKQVWQHWVSEVSGLVLDGGIHQRSNPAGCHAQHDFEAKELRFLAGGQHGPVKGAVERAQGAGGADVKDLKDPKLGAVLEPNREALFNAQAAPKERKGGNGQENVGPGLDSEAGAGVRPHPGERSERRHNKGHEAVDSVLGVTDAEPKLIAKQETENGQKVAVGHVPQNPANAELECLGVLPDLHEQGHKAANGQSKKVGALGPGLAGGAGKHKSADNGRDHGNAAGNGDCQEVAMEG